MQGNLFLIIIIGRTAADTTKLIMRPWGYLPKLITILLLYINLVHVDSCDQQTDSSDSIIVIAIIAGSCGMSALLCCLSAIAIIARIIVLYVKKSRQRTVASAVTNTTAGASTQLSTAYIAVGETFNQPGFQLQKFDCGNY